MTAPLHTPRLTTTTALARAWRNLTQDGSFTRHSVWLMLLDADHRPVCPVIELEDAVDPPPPQRWTALEEFLAELTREVPRRPCRLAVLRSRPGRGLPTAQDRAWGAALRSAGAAVGLDCLAVHFADDDHLVALPGRSPDSGPASERDVAGSDTCAENPCWPASVGTPSATVAPT